MCDEQQREGRERLWEGAARRGREANEESEESECAITGEGGGWTWYVGQNAGWDL